MIRRMASGLVMAVLLVALCVPAMGQFPPDYYLTFATAIDFTALQDSYRSYPFYDEPVVAQPPCAADNSTWYTFTLTEATQIGIYAAGYAEGTQWGPISDSRVEVQAALYRDDGGLVEVRCGTGGSALDVQFIELLSAGTYYVQVGTAALPHSYRLVIAPSPANDEISGAQIVTLPSHFYYRPHGTTASSGDGDYTCADHHSIWFTFTLDHAQKLNFAALAAELNGPGLTFPRMGLYKAGSSLSLIKCTGDGTGEFNFDSVTAFTMRVDAGTYYLQVGIGGGMPHDHIVLINGVPTNDDLANAQRLRLPVGEIGEMVGGSGGRGLIVNAATIEKDTEPAAHPGCAATLSHSVWYKFQLDKRQVVTLAQSEYMTTLAGPQFSYFEPTVPQYMDLWRKSGGLEPAACSLKGKIVKTLDAGIYYLRIASPIKLHKHALSSYSLIGKSEPVGMPTIIDHPEDVVVRQGQEVAFSVATASTTPLSYQWYSGYSGDTSSPIDGATGPIFTIPAAAPTSPPINTSKPFWVRVSNAAGYRDSKFAWLGYSDSIIYTEMLDNGNFEDKRAGWTLQNASGDKVACNDKGYQSPCAFMFTGGAVEKALISQTQPLPPESLTARLLLRLRAKMRSTNKPLVVTVTITYSDGTPPYVKKLTYPALSGYMRLSDNVFLYGPNHAVENVTVTIRHKSTTGKTFVDEIELLLGRYQTSDRGAEILPPPDAPDGFRGTN